MDTAWGLQILTVTFTAFSPGGAPQLRVTLQVLGLRKISFILDKHKIVIIKKQVDCSCLAAKPNHPNSL